MSKWIIESLGAIAQQGGFRSLDALLELAAHHDPEIQAQALSELSVPIGTGQTMSKIPPWQKIYELTKHPEPLVAESALAALQNLADVGCRRAEEFFASSED